MIAVRCGGDADLAGARRSTMIPDLLAHYADSKPHKNRSEEEQGAIMFPTKLAFYSPVRQEWIQQQNTDNFPVTQFFLYSSCYSLFEKLVVTKVVNKNMLVYLQFP